jgi:hypothetical protein
MFFFETMERIAQVLVWTLTFLLEHSFRYGAQGSQPPMHMSPCPTSSPQCKLCSRQTGRFLLLVMDFQRVTLRSYAAGGWVNASQSALLPSHSLTILYASHRKLLGSFNNQDRDAVIEITHGNDDDSRRQILRNEYFTYINLPSQILNHCAVLTVPGRPCSHAPLHPILPL